MSLVADYSCSSPSSEEEEIDKKKGGVIAAKTNDMSQQPPRPQTSTTSKVILPNAMELLESMDSSTIYATNTTMPISMKRGNLFSDASKGKNAEKRRKVNEREALRVTGRVSSLAPPQLRRPNVSTEDSRYAEKITKPSYVFEILVPRN